VCSSDLYITDAETLARHQTTCVENACHKALDITSYKNMLYFGDEHMNAIKAYDKGFYSGWYLG
jgi:hypothetical protein